MRKEELRQVIETSSNIASIVTNYYFELKQLGHSDENAIKLAMAYQTSIMGMNSKH